MSSAGGLLARHAHGLCRALAAEQHGIASVQSRLLQVQQPLLSLLGSGARPTAVVASSRACSSSAASLSAVASESAASTSGQDQPGWLFTQPKESKAKEPFWRWLFMRKQPDGQHSFIGWNERLMWLIGIGGISYFVVPRIVASRKRSAEAKIAEEALEKQRDAKRLATVHAFLAGRSFVADEEDPFEGMTPKQIAEYVKKQVPNTDDPFDGMSPEEIDEYARKYGIEPS